MQQFFRKPLLAGTGIYGRAGDKPPALHEVGCLHAVAQRLRSAGLLAYSAMTLLPATSLTTISAAKMMALRITASALTAASPPIS